MVEVDGSLLRAALAAAGAFKRNARSAYQARCGLVGGEEVAVRKRTPRPRPIAAAAAVAVAEAVAEAEAACPARHTRGAIHCHLTAATPRAGKVVKCFAVKECSE